MKFIRKQLFFWLVFLIAFNSFAQSNIDVLHYKFNVELNNNNDSIYGKAIIKVIANENINSATFDLSGLSVNGKGMVVGYVLTDWKTQKPITWKHENNKLIIYDAHRKGDTVAFTISYKGIPNDGLIISTNKYGDRTFFADNWPNRAHNWIPCKDEPGDKASFEFIVKAPSEYEVISNGELAEEKNLADNLTITHWSEDIPLSTKVMVIGVARFAVKQYADSPPDIPVSAWVYPQDSITGFHNYSVAPEIIKFYSDYIAPYPYNKLANVQSKTIFGGMENASCIFYYEASAEENRSQEDLLAHEIAHQWFGDMASEKSFPHLWLSEGFATYFTDMYLESRYGTDSMNRRLTEERRRVISFAKRSDKPVVDSISSLMNLLDANSYQKGGWILHMLRRQMGDSTFHTFIRTYYDHYKGSNANTNDLEQIAEEVSQQDLHTFFKQWLYTPGIPQLTIQWKYDDQKKNVLVTVNQTQSEGAFQFPLQIKLESRDTSKITTLNITKQTETFSIPVASPVNNIIADPNTDLLFDGKVEKMNQ